MSEEFNNNTGNENQGDFNPPPPPQQPIINNVVVNQPSPDDVPSTVLNIVSCCIPLVGLILYLVWKDQKPISAKQVGKWALIGFGIAVVVNILAFALGLGGALLS